MHYVRHSKKGSAVRKVSRASSWQKRKSIECGVSGVGKGRGREGVVEMVAVE